MAAGRDAATVTSSRISLIAARSPPTVLASPTVAAGSEPTAAQGRLLRGEGGSGSVLMLGIATAACLAALALSAVGAALFAHARAQAAADLGALAAAQALLEGQGSEAACAAAGRIVEENGAVLVHCDPRDDLSVQVTATVAVNSEGWDWFASLVGQASARAGPPTAHPSPRVSGNPTMSNQQVETQQLGGMTAIQVVGFPLTRWRGARSARGARGRLLGPWRGGMRRLCRAFGWRCRTWGTGCSLGIPRRRDRLLAVRRPSL